jgi:ornithine cyclodeaminase
MTLVYFDDVRIDALLDVPACAAVLDQAFADLALGQATVQSRQRSDCGGVKLSTMGALWLSRRVAGVKAYTTVDGQFSFLVTLFDTAAKLALFGAGQQGRAQAEALCALRSFDEVAVVDPQASAAWCEQLAAQHRCRVVVCEPRAALRGAHLVVTATRSKTPVFDGACLEPGALVIAMGTSLPNGRELDDSALKRASRVLVEWKPQSLVEAGEIVLGMAAEALDAQRIADLAELYAGQAVWRASDDEIVVFKSVGIGLADVACAWLAWQRSAQVAVEATALINA